VAIYPHENDTDFLLLKAQFKRDNGREPNDLDKLVLTQLWADMKREESQKI